MALAVSSGLTFVPVNTRNHQLISAVRENATFCVLVPWMVQMYVAGASSVTAAIARAALPVLARPVASCIPAVVSSISIALAFTFSGNIVPQRNSCVPPGTVSPTSSTVACPWMANEVKAGLW
jgi:hypothetical protein